MSDGGRSKQLALMYSANQCNFEMVGMLATYNTPHSAHRASWTVHFLKVSPWQAAPLHHARLRRLREHGRPARAYWLLGCKTDK